MDPETDPNATPVPAAPDKTAETVAAMAAQLAEAAATIVAMQTALEETKAAVAALKPVVPTTDGDAKPATTPRQVDPSSLPVFSRMAAGYRK